MTVSSLFNADPQAFLSGLAERVQKILPDAAASGLASDRFTVQHDRSLGDRLAGRPGTITRLQLDAGKETLTLGYAKGPRWTAEVARVSGGVIISRRSMPLGEWLAEFAGRVAAIAADTAGDAAAAARVLQALGLEPAGADIRVDDATLIRDLHGLPARLEGRVPAQAITAVEGIASLIADTIPRVESNAEAEFAVRRTATDYLPDTLRAYLSLPADWVRGHVFANGLTPEQSFLAQLSTIEDAVKKMHEAAVEADATALLTNGRFLADRFTPPDIHID